MNFSPFFPLFLSFLDDDHFDFGYKINDYEGLISKEAFYKYLTEFKYDCFRNNTWEKCSYDPAQKEYVYDSYGDVLNICRPNVKRLRSVFTNFIGLQYLLSSVEQLVVLVLINVCIVLSLM